MPTRQLAFTVKNILLGWQKSGLDPVKPEIVLNTIARPSPPPPPTGTAIKKPEQAITRRKLNQGQNTIISTPRTSNNLTTLRQEVCYDLWKGGLNTVARLRVLKVTECGRDGVCRPSPAT